jgi:hypothetical protein
VLDLLKRLLAWLRGPEALRHATHEVEWGRRLAAALTAAGWPAEAEVRLADGTRADVLTADYAVEIDWAPKWAESIGQALYYANRTGRKPAVILMLERDHDANFLWRLRRVAEWVAPAIDVWVMDVRLGVLWARGREIRV